MEPMSTVPVIETSRMNPVLPSACNMCPSVKAVP